MRKRIIGILIVCGWVIGVSGIAQRHVTIDNPETWTVSELSKYSGETVIFDTPFYVTSNYSGLQVSPRRIFSPTNQARPKTEEYTRVATLNQKASVDLYGVSGYHRLGEKIYNLKAKVSSSSLTMLDGEWRENSRADLEAGIPSVDQNGEHRLLICTMNLEYYMTEQFSSGYSDPGPKSDSQHQKQRAKISKALAKINADLYGFIELQLGDGAIRELATDLSTNTGRNFTYINDGSSVSGTFIRAGFVYDADKLECVGALQEIETAIQHRKKMQAFREKATGEVFIFSVNHFKAKSGGGTGANADQGDGQGGFNQTRVAEANAVLERYNKYKVSPVIHDEDILIMGDLNAYAKEDPIYTFLDQGLTDLHRYFHADTSYSYTYRSESGYLDHAICSASLLPQVTGMSAYHINSDESDDYTYDKSSDLTMFRCSDHDPVLVGLRLDSTLAPISQGVAVNSWEIYENGAKIIISHAYESDVPSYYRVYSVDGRMWEQGKIMDEQHTIDRPVQSGLYIIMVFDKGVTYKYKLIIP